MYGIYIMKIVISALAIIECERVTSIIATFEREAIVYRTFICSVCMSQILQSSERERKKCTQQTYICTMYDVSYVCSNGAAAAAVDVVAVVGNL